MRRRRRIGIRRLPVDPGSNRQSRELEPPTEEERQRMNLPRVPPRSPTPDTMGRFHRPSEQRGAVSAAASTEPKHVRSPTTTGPPEGRSASAERPVPGSTHQNTETGQRSTTGGRPPMRGRSQARHAGRFDRRRPFCQQRERRERPSRRTRSRSRERRPHSPLTPLRVPHRPGRPEDTRSPTRDLPRDWRAPTREQIRQVLDWVQRRDIGRGRRRD